jgi:hypothetical protein
MNMEIEVRNQAYLVFNAVEGASCDFAEKLLVLGVDRVIGRALCMEWASEKYHARITTGQRGPKLPRNSAAEQAFYRVVAFVWPATSATPKKAKRSNTDPVAKLLAAYGKLTAGQKRSFKAGL